MEHKEKFDINHIRTAIRDNMGSTELSEYIITQLECIPRYMVSLESLRHENNMLRKEVEELRKIALPDFNAINGFGWKTGEKDV